VPRAVSISRAIPQVPVPEWIRKEVTYGSRHAFAAITTANDDPPGAAHHLHSACRTGSSNLRSRRPPTARKLTASRRAVKWLLNRPLFPSSTLLQCQPTSPAGGNCGQLVLLSTLLITVFNAPHGKGLTWCPAGGGHDHFESLEYFLDPNLYQSFDPRPIHPHWYRCDRCAALTHSPSDYAWHGWCPAGGAHRNVAPADGEYYNLWETVPPNPPTRPTRP
jgi:hypothetical protein